jgi:methylated-DNA-[protein]-cysteine S-methyltransferase
VTSTRSKNGTASEPLIIAELKTPGGRLTVIVDPEEGAVVASAFGDRHRAIEMLPPGLVNRGVRKGSVGPVAEAVAAWSAGKLNALDKVKVRQPGSPFLEAAWAELRKVPAGTVVTYGELAELAGKPRAARAAGRACSTNRVAPFVPCHRVVPASGGVGPYGYGVPVKVALLAHEGVDVAT